MAMKSEYSRRRAGRKNNSGTAWKSWLPTTVIIVLLIVALAAYGQWNKLQQTKIGNQVPTDCLFDVSIPDDIPEIKIEYTGFNVSFNPVQHVPNYVVWELTGDETHGQEPRYNRFMPDDDVLGCATLDDYRRSGFDRGHMAPAADMKWSHEAMVDSHYLTNICPQDHALNGGRWNTLENKCRQWAQRDSAIIVIAGPILSDRITRRIGSSGVAVPERFFKVIYAPYADPPRAIAFIMPNSRIDDTLESLAVSVDRIEEITGFDFFSCLPDDIENRIESECYYRRWNLR